MLDVMTERGRESVRLELEAADLFERATGVGYFATPKDGAADVDAVLMRHGRIVGVAEMKCRNMTAFDLSQTYRNEWLITFSKLMRLCAASKAFGVPGVGMLYLVPESELLVVRLCDEQGDLIQPTRIERTETQATCNGGTAHRVNAFVNMSYARSYR